MAMAEEVGMLMDESSLKDSSLVPSQDGARLQYIRRYNNQSHQTFSVSLKQLLYYLSQSSLVDLWYFVIEWIKEALKSWYQC